MDSQSGEITRLLQAWSSGDRGVEERLFDLVLPELRRLARSLMRKERRGHTLQTTALLNEAYLRLLNARENDWENRRHFFAVAARAMRRLLVDHGRARTLEPKLRTAANVELLRAKDDRFEQVMAYFWVTEAQKYIQSLGFGSTYRPINMESQDIRINQFGIDNSYSWDKNDVLRFGKGGVDDAEDAEVILHEYGHAMLDSQSTPFGAFGASAEAGAMHEGFGDYWAVTVSAVIAPTADLPCVADWDAVSYTSGTPHCLRRVDTNLHYPEDLNGRVHHDGQIWSRALWDIRNDLGHVKADTIILMAQFSFAPDSSMPAAAQKEVESAEQLYGHSTALKVKAHFEDRGIL